jgi:hypothetical protein
MGEGGRGLHLGGGGPGSIGMGAGSRSGDGNRSLWLKIINMQRVSSMWMRTSRVQLEHLTASTFVATVLGSILAPSKNTVEVEGRYR